jgi:hypothetical protein
MIHHRYRELALDFGDIAALHVGRSSDIAALGRSIIRRRRRKVDALAMPLIIRKQALPIDLPQCHLFVPKACFFVHFGEELS